MNEKICNESKMVKTIEQMTCEELTATYVVLRELENKAKVLNFENLSWYISNLKMLTEITHHDKLEDMRREFFEGRHDNVQH